MQPPSERSHVMIRKKPPPIAVFCIEGENVTYAQIIERVACTLAQAQSRMSEARRKGRVTWASLQR